MDISCPHCGQPGISKIAKFRANPKSPAICSLCGKESAIEQGIKVKVLLLVTFLLMLIGPALYAFAYPSLWFMLLALVPLIALPLVIYLSVPLAPISKDEIARANYAYKVAILLLVIYLAYTAYDLSQSL